MGNWWSSEVIKDEVDETEIINDECDVENIIKSEIHKIDIIHELKNNPSFISRRKANGHKAFI